MDSGSVAFLVPNFWNGWTLGTMPISRRLTIKHCGSPNWASGLRQAGAVGSVLGSLFLVDSNAAWNARTIPVSILLFCSTSRSLLELVEIEGLVVKPAALCYIVPSRLCLRETNDRYPSKH